jgi:hypothetical protein
MSQNSVTAKTSSLGWVTSAAPWVAIIISAISAAFAFYGANISSKALLVANRAFVFPAAQNIYVSSDPKTYEPYALNLVFSITNSGNTPTLNLSLSIRCATALDDLKEPWHLLYQGPGDIRRTAMIGPKSSASSGCYFTMPQVNDFAAKRLHGYVLMEIEYRDRIDPATLRRSRMSAKITEINIRPPVAGTNIPVIETTLEPRGAQNCADEECP